MATSSVTESSPTTPVTKQQHANGSNGGSRTRMSQNNIVETVLVENEQAAVYVMGAVTSSNGAVSGAKSHFADEHDVAYSDLDATLFTKGYGPADNVAAVKNVK